MEENTAEPGGAWDGPFEVLEKWKADYYCN